MKQKLNTGIMTICLVLLTMTVIKLLFFSDWTFNSPEAYNLFYIVHYCSMAGLVGSILAKWKSDLFAVEILLVMLIWALIGYGELNPIDTTTFPRDRFTLKQINNNKKIVLVEYKNCKTNRVYQDTIQVIDSWIFRKIER